MSESKHTPGPWQTNERNADDNTLAIRTVEGQPTQLVAWITPQPFYKEGMHEGRDA
jgi:hypothetical protein